MQRRLLRRSGEALGLFDWSDFGRYGFGVQVVALGSEELVQGDLCTTLASEALL
jgi:hypothetical protein